MKQLLVAVVLLMGTPALAVPKAPAPKATANVTVKPEAKKPEGLASALKGPPGQENVPMFIRSDNFQLDSKNRLFIYKDNVEIVKGDLTITADLMTGKYDLNNVIQEITCENNVVITRGERLRATSNHAFYDLKSDRITLTEGPELNDRGNDLTADKVIILVKEDRSEAQGHVRVKVLKSDEKTDIMKSMKGGGAKPVAPAQPAPKTKEAEKSSEQTPAEVLDN
jgi:lipopolysaccharide transport protein LptA